MDGHVVSPRSANAWLDARVIAGLRILATVLVAAAAPACIRLFGPIASRHAGGAAEVVVAESLFIGATICAAVVAWRTMPRGGEWKRSMAQRWLADIALASAALVAMAVLASGWPAAGAARRFTETSVLVLIPSVAEEFVFRGLVLEYVRSLAAIAGTRRTAMVVAIAASSAAFAAAHGLPGVDGLDRAGLLVVARRAGAGAVLGWLAMHTRGLLAPVLAHAAYNAALAA